MKIGDLIYDEKTDCEYKITGFSGDLIWLVDIEDKVGQTFVCTFEYFEKFCEEL